VTVNAVLQLYTMTFRCYLSLSKRYVRLINYWTSSISLSERTKYLCKTQ